MQDFHARYASIPQTVAKARRAIIAYCRIAGFTGDILADIELAVGEALANVAEHGVSKGATEFDVRASVEREMLVIEVQDNGRGFVSGQIRPVTPGVESLRGYGSSIMRSVMDHVEYKQGGTCVRLVKRLPSADAALLEKDN